MRTLSSNAPIALISPSISPVIPVLIDEAAGRSFASASPKMQVPPRTPKDRAAVAQRIHHPANSELKRRAAHSSRSVALQAEHDYSEASISLEGAVSPLEVDALTTATALDRDAASITSKDWAIGLFCPPMQSLITCNKTPKFSKGFPQSPGTKRQKGDQQ